MSANRLAASNKRFFIFILLFGKALSIGPRRSCVIKVKASQPAVGYGLSQPALQERAAKPQVFSARSSLHPFASLAATQLEYFSSHPRLQAIWLSVEVTPLGGFTIPGAFVFVARVWSLFSCTASKA